MLTKTQAISEFLDKQSIKVDLYHPKLEVQVNVIPGPDRIKDEKKLVWTDGTDTWSPFRIPYSGSGIDAEPYYHDTLLDYNFEKYVEAIGLTGWNWQDRLSLWVGFDFDSIHGHAKGLADSDLDDLRRRVREIPWITLRRSKSGYGYHLYVTLKHPVETRNHTEHAALARYILSQLSATLAFNFEDKVDASGGVLWVWHREASREKRSFEVIKEATEKFICDTDVWKDFISTTRRKNITPKRLADNERQYKDLVSRTKVTKLDDEHRELIAYLAEIDHTAWWDAERNMLITHTYTLKKAHQALKLRGIYDTTSTGKEAPNDHNCFCFPDKAGSWKVFRYTLGASEHKSWSKSPAGWTYIEYNRLPTLESLARINGGLKTRSGEYRFLSARDAGRVVDELGGSFTLPEKFASREAKILPGKAESELVLSIPYEEGDDPQADWYVGGRPKSWERVFTTLTETKEVVPPDDVVRHATYPGGKGLWFVLSRGRWVEKTESQVRLALTSLQYPKKEIPEVMGAAVLDDWECVTLPFEDEYPGDRQWNLEAPQLAYTPRYGPHPTWDLLFQHVGKNLETSVSSWCNVNQVSSGAHYLKLWVASVLRYPFEPLPYLFFYGPQNSGKSVFHEALNLLLHRGKGYARADQALTNPNGYNGELYGSVIDVVEEVNVSQKRALERIKDWVTGKHIHIRRLYHDGFITPNTTHWIQCANDASYCPVFPGDTRITAIYVEKFEGDEIPKPELFERLVAEAPQMLYQLFKMELPPSNTRLRIPVIDSEIKSDIQDANKDVVQEFLEEHCEYAEGWVTGISALMREFMSTLSPDEQMNWNSRALLKAIPLGQFTKGLYSVETHVGNLKLKGGRPGSRQIKTGRVIKDGRKLG